MLEGLKKFIERGKKGYCYSDLWEFDNFLSKFLTNALKEFKKNVHSYPSSDITWEGWMQTLDEMIECFDEQSRSVDNLPLKDTDDSRLKEFDFDVYHKRQELKKKKLHRGLELLEKYYYDLWD